MIRTREERIRFAERAVVKAAMEYALVYKKPTWSKRKWWDKRDVAEAVLFARCTRLEKLERSRP